MKFLLFYVWNSLNWTDEDTYCGWKVLPGEQGHNTLSTIWETRWWHSVTPKPHKYVGEHLVFLLQITR